MKKHVLLTLVVGFLAGSVFGAEDIVVGDFEGSDFGKWKVSGEAFGSAPAPGAIDGQSEVKGFSGHGFANSFHGGDRSTGSLISAEFVIQRKYISFLIGGGGGYGKTGISLKAGGKVQRETTAADWAANGDEDLVPGVWDVSELKGQAGKIEIIDASTSNLGHFNVDQIVQTDTLPAGLQLNAIRQFTFDKKFLNLPVKSGAAKRRVSVMVNDETVREFDIELADSAPDYWTFLDITPFRGKQATVQVSCLAKNSKALALMEQGDQIKGGENLYRESARQQFHFSSARGWNNDPNGLVYYKGEYHLFYQHNPYGWKWGNMHWGHAVSSDLVHWRELPVAIYPKRYGDWAFSGSAVVDPKNTSGFKTGKEDVIVVAYTSLIRGECIVYSNDRGRTFTEFEGNPVVKHRGRDPRLFWHEPTQQWVMVVYDEDPAEPDRIKTRHFAFYTSPDLKTWTFQSRIAGFYECPDMFELPVDGDAKNKKWILTDASSQYMVGAFDGRTFTPETAKLPGHRGASFYAAQTYSDIPARDGRRVQIGWLQAPTPNMPFNQAMSFPCELTLHSTAAGPRLFFQPVKELKTLYGKKYQWKNLKIAAGKNPTADLQSDLLDISVDLKEGDVETTTLFIRGARVTYDFKQHNIVSQGVTNSLPTIGNHIHLRILADRTSLEIFGNDGALYMPLPMNATQAIEKSHPPLAIEASGISSRIAELVVRELKTAWSNNKDLY